MIFYYTAVEDVARNNALDVFFDTDDGKIEYYMVIIGCYSIHTIL